MRQSLDGRGGGGLGGHRRRVRLAAWEPGRGVDGSCSGAWAVGGRQASAVGGGDLEWSSCSTTLSTLAENVIRCRTSTEKAHPRTPTADTPASSDNPSKSCCLLPCACRLRNALCFVCVTAASQPLPAASQSTKPAVIRRAPPDSIAHSPLSAALLPALPSSPSSRAPILRFGFGDTPPQMAHPSQPW